MREGPSIDLSYKDDAWRVYYDIESIGSLFTNTFLTEKSATLWFFGDPAYDHISDEALKDAFASYLRSDAHRKRLGLADGEELEIVLERFYVGDTASMTRLRQSMLQFMLSQPLPGDFEHAGSPTRFTEYVGWNSRRYDLPLTLLTSIAIDGCGDRPLTPAVIRALSDTIISFDGYESKYPGYVQVEMAKRGVVIPAQTYTLRLNTALWHDGHIDMAAIARGTEEGEDSQFPPALKKEMAKFGLDIVIDDAVTRGSPDDILSDDEVLDLVSYNLNDVVGTKLISQNKVLVASVQTRDIVRRMYPYTASKATPFGKLQRWAPAERDCTAATLAGLVLDGPNRRKPRDYPVVRFDFPVPDGAGGQKTVDLLEYMVEKEAFMPPLVYKFFDHYRGNDTTTSRDMWQLNLAQPITHKPTMNAPYYRDGKPIDCYITVSTGGAHGGVMAGLSDFSDSEVEEWMRSNAGAPSEAVPTIDMPSVVHIDWSSFYPVMASKMQMYMTDEGVDRYTGVIEYRFEIKDKIPHDRSLWDDEVRALQEEQMGLKFILNNATGAGNMHKKYALLPVDNKTLSMRLIGNMNIWCLGQRLAQAGAFIISTNTDGLYICGLTVSQAQEVIDGYVADYGMGVDPELVERFINRDTSNRIEIVNGHVNDVRGRLRHGVKMHYVDDSISRNVSYPLVAAHAAVRYMTDDPHWLLKPYDRDRLKSIVRELYLESDSPEAWYHINLGSSTRRLLVNGVPQQRTNRVVLTVIGDTLSGEELRKLSKAAFEDLWARRVEHSSETLGAAAEALELNIPEHMRHRRLDELVLVRQEKVEGQRDKVLMRTAEQPDGTFDRERFAALWRDTGAHSLALPADNGGYEPVKSWRKSKMSGYTSETGVLLNTIDEVESFDMGRLDLDAYVDWAESLVDGWKVTADIPEIGLVSVDDTVVEVKKKVRVTKKSIAEDQLRAVYDSSLKRVLGAA